MQFYYRNFLFTSVGKNNKGNLGYHGSEIYNFRKTYLNEREDISGVIPAGDYCLGFWPTKLLPDGKWRYSSIERVRGSGYPNRPIPYLDKVTLVWFAKLPETDELIVVGWYFDATIYRNHQEIAEEGYVYNVRASYNNCTLLPEELRDSKIWRGPYNDIEGFGFNKVNYCPPQTDRTGYLENLMNMIKGFTDANC